MLKGDYCLKHLAEYLSNPIQTGVYHSRITADFSELGRLIRDIAKRGSNFPGLGSESLTEIAEAIEEEDLDLDGIKENFNKAILCLYSAEECPTEIERYVCGQEMPKKFFIGEFIPSEGMSKKAKAGFRRIFGSSMEFKPPPKVFESRILDDVNDVLAIEVEETDKKNVLSFEITTIKEKDLTRFHDFLKCVPFIGDTVRKIHERKTHSSRYCFLPYPFAVQLWLGHEKTAPKDLKDFLRGSIRYYSEQEWRTSIVLSAIVVESILADLYEEQHKEYAPSVPLGELYHRVKDKAGFSSDIKSAIKMVNNARISAVHRSRFPVSNREAINALHGATTFIMWYSSNF